jgi:hypothetical protein
MYVKSFVFAVGLVTLTGCAGTVAIPALGLDHPANPQAAAAPLPPVPTLPESSSAAVAQVSPHAGVAGIDHGSTGGMQGRRETNHGAKQGMLDMDVAQDSMEGMGHGSMKGMDHGSMRGMDQGSMPGMKGMKGRHHGQ